MSDVQTGGDSGGGKHQKKRAKKSSTRIDMTPMVDLAFLLLTFFVLTSTFSKPTTMEITMPMKDPDDTSKIKVKRAITIMLTGEDKIFYYVGVMKEDTEFKKTTFDDTKGIRKVILELNKEGVQEIKNIEKEVKKLNGKISEDSMKTLYDSRVAALHRVIGDKATYTVIIKPDEKAKYKNVIDIVDEMSICQIGKYAIVDISQAEKDVLKEIDK